MVFSNSCTFTKKNSIIFRDNDFEVFIDPESSGENYYEYEMNALNTIWELTLVRRYTKGGPAISPTNLPGLIHRVFVDGTINDPDDKEGGTTQKQVLDEDDAKAIGARMATK